MNEPDQAEFYIEVSAADATEEEIDRMARQLLAELRETDVETAELARGGELPSGAKSGESITMGSIFLSALPTVLPSVITLVQAWAARGQGRTVKFKGKVGRQMIEFEGPPEELQRLLDTLSRGKKK
jgi:hypothetical protein